MCCSYLKFIKIVFEGEKYTFLSLSFFICKTGVTVLTSTHTL